jgi:hypothetical protein
MQLLHNSTRLLLKGFPWFTKAGEKAAWARWILQEVEIPAVIEVYTPQGKPAQMTTIIFENQEDCRECLQLLSKRSVEDADQTNRWRVIEHNKRVEKLLWYKGRDHSSGGSQEVWRHLTIERPKSNAELAIDKMLKISLECLDTALAMQQITLERKSDVKPEWRAGALVNVGGSRTYAVIEASLARGIATIYIDAEFFPHLAAHWDHATMVLAGLAWPKRAAGQEWSAKGKSKGRKGAWWAEEEEEQEAAGGQQDQGQAASAAGASAAAAAADNPEEDPWGGYARMRAQGKGKDKGKEKGKGKEKNKGFGKGKGFGLMIAKDSEWCSFPFDVCLAKVTKWESDKPVKTEPKVLLTPSKDGEHARKRSRAGAAGSDDRQEG